MKVDTPEKLDLLIKEWAEITGENLNRDEMMEELLKAGKFVETSMLGGETGGGLIGPVDLASEEQDLGMPTAPTGSSFRLIDPKTGMPTEAVTHGDDALTKIAGQVSAQYDPQTSVTRGYVGQMREALDADTGLLPSGISSQDESVRGVLRDIEKQYYTENLPRSAGQAAVDYAEVAQHPMMAIAGVRDLAASISNKMFNFATGDTSGQGEEMANGLGKLVKERYGTLPRAIETAYLDPVGFLGDASIIFPLAGGTPGIGFGLFRGLSRVMKLKKLIDAVNKTQRISTGVASAVSKAERATKSVTRPIMDLGRTIDPVEAVIGMSLKGTKATAKKALKLTPQLFQEIVHFPGRFGRGVQQQVATILATMIGTGPVAVAESIKLFRKMPKEAMVDQQAWKQMKNAGPGSKWDLISVFRNGIQEVKDRRYQEYTEKKMPMMLSEHSVSNGLIQDAFDQIQKEYGVGGFGIDMSQSNKIDRYRNSPLLGEAEMGPTNLALDVVKSYLEGTSGQAAAKVYLSADNVNILNRKSITAASGDLTDVLPGSDSQVVMQFKAETAPTSGNLNVSKKSGLERIEIRSGIDVETKFREDVLGQRSELSRRHRSLEAMAKRYAKKYGVPVDLMDEADIGDQGRRFMPDGKIQDVDSESVSQVAGYMPGDKNAASLDLIKQQLDNMLEKMGPMSAETKRSAAVVSQLRDAIRKTLEEVPGYDELTSKYAAASEILRGIDELVSPKSMKASVQDKVLADITDLLSDDREMGRAVMGSFEQYINRPVFAQLLGSQFSSAEQLRFSSPAPSLPIGRQGNRGWLAFLSAPLGQPKLWGEVLRTMGASQRKVDEAVSWLGQNRGTLLQIAREVEELERAEAQGSDLYQARVVDPRLSGLEPDQRSAVQKVVDTGVRSNRDVQHALDEIISGPLQQ